MMNRSFKGTSKGQASKVENAVRMWLWHGGASEAFKCDFQLSTAVKMHLGLKMRSSVTEISSYRSQVEKHGS